ncbi:TetR family transcriptional regulator [Streptomyces sp. SID8379]|uniref:TetR/AcrR family transcriptional regulator n=1 Tax=unclassified Streptomyces TaxID=2593676 RepID=UPI00035E0A61|nr:MULTISPECIES: TetR/AcrR family transcriptional regulator [unclassified Streptomyces]MYW66532.1 TetR family transcriptional regulator [Streptomyces sp. SID8379]
MAQVEAAGRPVRPKRADARRNYERLLREAGAAFAEKGAQASLDEIAKRAGVGSGTLYRHFPTREALMEAVYVDLFEELAERARKLRAELPAGEALFAWLAELGEQIVRARAIKPLLGAAVSEGPAPVVTRCGDCLKTAAADLLAAAQEAGAVRADLTHLELLRLNHAVVEAAEMGGGDARDMARYRRLMLEGLRPPA